MDSAQLDESTRRAARAESDLAETLQQLEGARAHNDSLQADIKKLSTDIKATHMQTSDAKRSQEEIALRYQAAVREASNVAARERDMAAALQVMEAELREFKQVHGVLKADYAALQENHDQVLRVCKKQELRIAEVESELIDSHKALQRALDQAEDSNLEREKAVVREQQAQAEILRLNARVDDIPKKMKAKAEAEVHAVRAQFTADRKSHNDEITALQTEMTDLKSLADRAIREKRSAESELDKLTRCISTEGERVAGIVEDLSTRLRAAERERADAVTKLETFHQRHSRDETRFEADRVALSSRAEDACRRLRRVERELQETKEERVALFSRAAELEHQNKVMEEHKIKATHHATAELNSMCAKYESQVADLTARLQSTSDAHAKACKELQELLCEQRRTGERWKDESARLAASYTSALHDVQTRLARSEERAVEAQESCAVQASRIRDLTAQVTEDRKVVARLQQTLRDADARAADKERGIRDLQRKCLDAAEERKRLQRELDRALLERERMERDRAFQAKHGARNARLAMLPRNDTEHRSLEAAALQAEILRVHQRSSQQSMKHESVKKDDSDTDDEFRPMPPITQVNA
ncbi:hypothetical protein SeLEV6574_g07928 [Synchytrium endobioticum]|uniref:Uncharacterized protein n=1 Tax=Synchytrium endobioticum TaxID=286115 RepID=A0A507CHZ7_9FUNG|nr:hypothetical protein SeLEV6574_g07928 [Synchytrium endobioticum]